MTHLPTDGDIQIGSFSESEYITDSETTITVAPVTDIMECFPGHIERRLMQNMSTVGYEVIFKAMGISLIPQSLTVTIK